MKHLPSSVRLVLFVFSLLLVSNTSLAVWQGQWYVKDPYPDYAPLGMPDFDQHGGMWGKVPGIMDPLHPENNPQNPAWLWTWDGPVAWANSVWWMDSRFETYINPFPVPPPAISDSFPLVYSADPAAFDDHNMKNVVPVVEQLSQLFLTDGDPWCSWEGTSIYDMVWGLEMGLDMAALGKWSHQAGSPYFVVGYREYPAFYEVAREVKRCQDVILLLGLYEENVQGGSPGEYRRVGGHYVTVAAVNTEEAMLRICDPFLDIANPGAGDHMDAAIVSHDQYTVQDLSPKGCGVIDYPWSLAIPGDPIWELLGSNFKATNPSGLPDIFVTSPRLGQLTLIEYMVHMSPEWDEDLYQKPPYLDYAPLGVPDFDQRQDMWGKVPGSRTPDDPENNPQNPLWRWSWCGPVALANSLWWMDSKMEDIVVRDLGIDPVPPPQPFDNFPLLRPYGDWDDHDPQNVVPFVMDLAGRMRVDGEPWCSWIGTLPQDLYKATVGYLRENGLYFDETGMQPDGIYFDVGLTPDPTFKDVSREVYVCQDVILLLGFYEYTDSGEYIRVGGHYVTCAGVDARGSRVLLSDPVVDTMDVGPLSGKQQPLQSGQPLQHNDPAFVSHDEYHVGTLSDGEFWLTDYPWSLGPQSDLYFLLRENFEGLNPSDLPPLDILHSCEYITKVEYMLHVSPVFWFWKGEGLNCHDYAQAGVPDFSQKQGKWGKVPGIEEPTHPENNPKNPAWQWTWCGPAAVANSLWWMDSQFETYFVPAGSGPVKPPTISDHFPLVQAYLDGIDDHHAVNVTPFIDDLAIAMSTDGEPWCAWQGTRVEDMVAGIRKYLDRQGLGPQNDKYDFWFEVGLTQDPDLIDHVAVELRRCQDVILLLGFYQLEQGFYTRVGGHFVTAAGLSEQERLLGISDPWLDTVAGDNGPSGPGRFGIPHDPVAHPSHQHNDADFVSHDVYEVGVLSDGENYLIDYPWSDMGDPQIWEKIQANFTDANSPKDPPPMPDVEPVGRLLTKIEFMVHVSPVGTPVAVPHVVPQHVAPGQILTFDGSSSYHTNPARSIVKYEWDFDGDGTYDATGAVVSDSYPLFGSFHGSLRVTDDDVPPVPAESFFDVFVDVGNNSPVADANGPYAISEGTDLLLDASGSYDPDTAFGDSIVSYRWDLDDDGVYDDAIGETPTVLWSLISGLKRAPDTNPVGLRVQDSLGKSDTDSTTLTIFVNAPVALFTAIPNPAPTFTPITFDASSSYHPHPDHSIVKYEWDFESDGLYDATGVTTSHSYANEGTYDVTLRVTDDNDPPETDTHVVPVRVVALVPPEEIVVGLGKAGSGWFEIIHAQNALLSHFQWKWVPWNWYAVNHGETRPALGDFDGDGRKEIVVGLGGGGGGRLALFDDAGTGYSFIRWIRIPWSAYNARNGETWPACGDVDGDGADEIVVGLGPGGSGWFYVFNDAGTAFAGLGWHRIPWMWYSAVNGETRPAVGDIDGDGKHEVVIGLGPFPLSGGWFSLFDDGSLGFPFQGWRRIPFGSYNAANGETWPVTGDIDADAKEEIVVGLGSYPRNGGWIAFYDDPVVGGFLGWHRLPWMDYNVRNGETHPATANIDRDGAAELIVGLDSGGRGIMWIADDWTSGVLGLGWYWIPWGSYSWLDGLSYPRAKALLPGAPEAGQVPAQDGGEGAPPESHESLTGIISGNVSSTAGFVDGAWVTAYSDSWVPVFSTRTDASGDYSLEGLEPGTYFVEATAEVNLVPEYYDDVPGIVSERGSASAVSVYPAIETSDIDFELAVGGMISGTVTDEAPTATPLEGATVTAYLGGDHWVPVTQAETDDTGHYSLIGLADTTYFLEASAPTPDLMGEYYDDVPATLANRSLALPVGATPGANVTPVDFALGPGGGISGTVTDQATGGAIEGTTVILYAEDAGVWQSIAATASGAAGEYEFGGLPPATYYLEANDPEGAYAREYYDDVGALLINRPTATAIALAEDALETGKNFLLSPAGSISGRVLEEGAGVSPISGVTITAYEQDWQTIAAETVTDSLGEYLIGRLPAGDYYVSVDGPSAGYTAEYFDDVPMTEEGKAKATLVSVSLGITTENINFGLSPQTYISGTVTDDGPLANPLPNVVVKAIDAATEGAAAETTTAGDGTYQILVDPGDYYVGAEGAGYANEYYKEASQLPDASVVSPAAGSPVEDVDFTLTPVGTILVVSDVEFAPFKLSSLGLSGIDENTGAGRSWESGELKPGTWTITWGAVPGYTAPPAEALVLDAGDRLTFFGHYTLAEGFRVNDLETTGEGAEKELRLEWYSEVGKMYQVQGTDDLHGAWQDIGSPQPGTGAVMSYVELIGETGIRFLRVTAY